MLFAQVRMTFLVFQSAGIWSVWALSCMTPEMYGRSGKEVGIGTAVVVVGTAYAFDDGVVADA